MSQENVEIVRATFEAWNAGDMDALREPCDPDVLTRTPEGCPEPGPFVGRDATMRWFEQLRDCGGRSPRSCTRSGARPWT
jgi:ketosteroid isomerase-like protein